MYERTSRQRKRMDPAGHHAPSSRAMNHGTGDRAAGTPTHPERCTCGGTCPRCRGGGVVQKKPLFGNANDPLERQADEVAARVMRQSTAPAEANGPASPDRRPAILPMSKSAGAGDSAAASQPVEALIASPGSGAPLSDRLRRRIEPVVGRDLSDVRVHSDERSREAARRIDARAFTNRNHIYLGENQRADDLPLMAHESAHVAQQSGSPSDREVQKASMVSAGERFVVAGSEGSYFDFGDLVSGVTRRYELDHTSSYQLARWLDEKHGIFRNGNRRYDQPVIPMPRMVAFFMVDWVEPFSAFGGQYGISREAFEKAQEIWARENVFVGFRRGGPVGGAGFRQIDFNPTTRSSGEENRNTAEELNLLALRSDQGLPPGYFHMVVTGNTTQDPTATGKAIRSRDEEPVAASSEGILLFAGSYTRLGYEQVVPRGDSSQEIAELLAHEIGHFLFGLTHNQPPQPTDEGFVIRGKGDIMQGGAGMDPDDRLGATSRREMERALEEGEVPRPATATSRR